MFRAEVKRFKNWMVCVGFEETRSRRVRVDWGKVVERKLQRRIMGSKKQVE
jgi:hypothetical protein